MYKKIELWCESAISMLGSLGVPEKIVEMQYAAVKNNSGKKSLYIIADDLAEGIKDLPDDVRFICNNKLIEDHGFGYEFFLDKKYKIIRDVLKRGFIKSDSEYREVIGVVSDVDGEFGASKELELILATYETSKK